MVAGCGDGNSLTDPQFEPQITNQIDSFELQATDITGVTETLHFTWDVLSDASGTVSFRVEKG